MRFLPLTHSWMKLVLKFIHALNCDVGIISSDKVRSRHKSEYVTNSKVESLFCNIFLVTLDL